MISLTSKERHDLIKMELILKNIAEPDPIKAAGQELTKAALAVHDILEDGPISRLVTEVDILTAERHTLYAKIYSLEDDIKVLIKVLNQVRSYNQDYENLKQKHQIY